ncbi:hypothetical protein M231_02656 [Tremella mesenterica]|uniref:Barwin domain-containing protein n=1 Tax=Tremella mesenterica TaxID=5217 RepID=A0A4Q1BQ18_TREME|nr:hypothetical protein M231_02656 [Tremella mesenterica]
MELEKRIIHRGIGRFYIPGLGACGYQNGPKDYVVGIYASKFIEDRGGNCGQKVRITNVANGKTVVATTVDECQTCALDGLDISPPAFEAINDDRIGDGTLEIDWSFLPK